MKDQDKSKTQLISELAKLRLKLAELEGIPPKGPDNNEINERKQAQENLRQRTAQLEALRELWLEFTVQLDLDSLLHSIVSRAIKLVNGTSGGYSLYRPRRGVLEWAVVGGENLPSTGLVIRRGEGLAGKVWENNQAIVVDNYQKWEHRLPGVEPYHMTNIMAVPVHWGDQFLGVLEVNADTPGVFTPADAEVLQLFATQAAIAIRNAQLYQDTNRRLAQTMVLQEVARAAASTLDFDKILHQTCRTLQTTMQVEFLSVALPTDHDTAITFHPSHIGYHKPIYQLRIPMDQCVCGHVFQTGEAMVIGDVRQVPFYQEEGQGVLSELAVPILSGGQVIGVLNVESRQLEAFDEADLGFFTAIATQLGVALENARLFREEQKRRREAETLRRSALVLVQDLDSNEVVEGILAQLQDVVPYDTATVQLLQEDKLEIVGGRGFPNLDELLGVSFSVKLDNNPNQEVVRTRTPFIVSDAPTVYSEFLREPHAQADIRSWLGVPMLVGERLIGMIALDRADPGFYTQEHAQLAEAFAAQAAIAIENAHLFEETRRQAQQVEQIIRTVPEGVVLLDSKGCVVTANPAALGFLETLAQATVGDTLTHLGGRPLAHLLTSPPTTGLWHEVFIETPLPLIFEVSSRPVEAGTEAESWVLVIRDVTREREVQQRIQQQEQLAAVGQLAAGIAHDFNNIMAVISLYTQLLLKTTTLTPKARDRLETVNLQAKRAGDLIQQILDFSRRAVLERQLLNLAPLMKEQVKLLQRTLPENIQLELVHDDGSYHVHADATRVQQIIMNLALNARDAMPTGGRLTIQLDRLQIDSGLQDTIPELAHSRELPADDISESGEWVRITVRDDGQGIPSEALPHIFEPFFTTKAPGKGTGLGLSQVYGIVRQHKGHIVVESKVGEGTTFTIYLPSLPAGEDDRQLLEMQDLPQGAGETILVVEDNPLTREAVVDCLESLNYQVLEAQNGQEALQILDQREKEITLIVTDLVMPTMGGLALLRALRQRQSAIQIVVMTGHPMESYIKEIERDNFADWLQKPLNLDELAIVVYRALTSPD